MSRIVIQVGMTDEELLQRADDAERRWKAGEITEDEPTYVVFGSWEELTKTLTPKRLELLRHLHQHPEVSIYALAKVLKRSYANVHADVEALVAAGLIERDNEGVRADFDSLTAEVAFA